jgi:hypothetical protein
LQTDFQVIDVFFQFNSLPHHRHPVSPPLQSFGKGSARAQAKYPPSLLAELQRRTAINIPITAF